MCAKYYNDATGLITLGLSVAGMGMAGKSLAKDGKALKAISKGNVNVKPAAVCNLTASSGQFKMDLQMFAKKSGSLTINDKLWYEKVQIKILSYGECWESLPLGMSARLECYCNSEDLMDLLLIF